MGRGKGEGKGGNLVLILVFDIGIAGIVGFEEGFGCCKY